MLNTRMALALFCFLGSTFSHCPAFAARFVPIKIYVDGELILEGNASDDGTPDADEVWDALKRVNLGETREFKRLAGDNIGDQLEIFRKQKGDDKAMPIRIEVAYGGTAEITALRIQRKSPDGAGRVWRIESQQVSDLFDTRYLSRSDAAGLSNPKRKK
jgi:hypothetical protein